MYLRATRPIRPALNSGFCTMKRLGISFFLSEGRVKRDNDRDFLLTSLCQCRQRFWNSVTSVKSLQGDEILEKLVQNGMSVDKQVRDGVNLE